MEIVFLFSISILFLQQQWQNIETDVKSYIDMMQVHACPMNLWNNFNWKSWYFLKILLDNLDIVLIIHHDKCVDTLLFQIGLKLIIAFEDYMVSSFLQQCRLYLDSIHLCQFVPKFLFWLNYHLLSNPVCFINRFLCIYFFFSFAFSNNIFCHIFKVDEALFSYLFTEPNEVTISAFEKLFYVPSIVDLIFIFFLAYSIIFLLNPWTEWMLISFSSHIQVCSKSITISSFFLLPVFLASVSCASVLAENLM